jgi:predicted transcriptional regulator
MGELEHELRLPQPSASKHLRVLRDAGFVESRIEAQRRLYRLRPEPLMELDAWLVPFRRFWSKDVDALELAPRSKRTERSGRSFSSATCLTRGSVVAAGDRVPGEAG